MTREQLDDTIDRVARELTMSPVASRQSPVAGRQSARGSAGDVTLSTTVRHAMTKPAPAGFSTALLAAAAAVVVLAVAVSVLSTARRTAVESRDALRTLESRTLAPVAPLATAMRQPAMSSRAEATPPTLHTTLEVTPLDVVPLSVAAIAEVAPLTVKDIAVSDIGGGEMKEYE